MKHLFVPIEIAKELKELNLNQSQCLAFYSSLTYPINEGGGEKETTCLYIQQEDRYDSVKMLYIDNKDAHFHWHEGTYDEGEHSRCYISGNPIPAPTYQQVIDWFFKEHGIWIWVAQCERSVKFEWFCRYERKGSCMDYDEKFYELPYEAYNAAITEAIKLVKDK